MWARYAPAAPFRFASARMATSILPSSTPDTLLHEKRLAKAPGREAGEAPAVDRDDALPPGTRLNEFELIRVLGAGGFGIVYLAQDHALLRQVAIKEYLPTELARRGESSQVSMRSASRAETFAAGLQSFVKEAQPVSYTHLTLP